MVLIILYRGVVGHGVPLPTCSEAAAAWCRPCAAHLGTPAARAASTALSITAYSEDTATLQSPEDALLALLHPKEAIQCFRETLAVLSSLL